jgi:hypothetical protein
VGLVPEQPVRFLVEIWNLLTYRTGGELPPPRPIPPPIERGPEVTKGKLLMLKVDRKTGDVWIATVRKERR